MGRPLYTNNAATYLAFGITNTATTMQVSANAGSLFPNPTGGDYFYVSLISLSGPIIEIVKCTARSGDIFTIERGQENTTPLYWNMGDNVQLRITAQSLNLFASETHAEEDLAAYEAAVAAPSGSSLVGYQEGASGTVARTVQARLQDFISVKDFGAVGNGIVDDTASIQAAINSIIGSGGTVYFPSGYYRVTSTIKVGKTIINNYTPLINRTVPASDALILSVTNSANYSYNQLNCVNISLISGGDVFFVADFSPSSPTPILEYNLSRESGRATKIEGSFSFIPMSCFSGNKYVKPTSYISNNLIGIAYPSQGCRNITNIFVASLTCGIFGISNYWVEYNNLEFTYCGDCLNIAQANAITVLNVLMTVSNRGIIYDGGASYIGSFHTESVANDLYVINAECTTFEAAYLEDSSLEDGTGLYAVTLGVDPSNPYNVVDCNFISTRVGTVRPNKKGYNLLNVQGSTFNACREYSNGIDASSISRANLIGTDFNISAQLPLTRFSRWVGGSDNYFSFNFPGSTRPCIGIYEFEEFNIVYSIAPNAVQTATITIPVLPTSNNYTINVTQTSGGDVTLVTSGRISAPTTLTVYFFNPSSSATITAGGDIAVSVMLWA